ncbi:MAG TPA: type VI secretion protein IcmF/TssM N-terminal domain-containing protein [Gemmataceae bacterium]|nr:type VI secretion protein IcmF/TssM N-terminal domain-containing protein [Gemmataceae bacterium]
MAFFRAMLAWIKKIVAAILPFKKGIGLSPWVRWLIWIVLDVSVLAILYLINSRSESLPAWLPDLGPNFRNWWLPALGQLVIFMVIVLYWFYVLWFGEEDDSPFPDIDAAWNEGMRALQQAGLSLQQLPLFFVIGRPGTSEQNLFEGSGLKLTVPQTPSDPRAPLHVFADKNGIYVSCRGASVLGKLASIISREEPAKAPVVQSAESSGQFGKTEVPWKREDLLIQEKVSAAEGREATTLEKRVLYRLSIGKPLGSELLADAREVSRLKARLAHLCRLIVRDRQPHCAANGVLVIVPLGSTDTPAEAQLTAQACQEDLHVARQEMMIDCPLLVMLADMEELPGFPDFIQLQSPAKLRNRRGGGFPMATRLNRDELLREIRNSLTWVCTTYLQDSVYKVFQSESGTNKDVTAMFPANARLALLLAEMNERADPLSTIILHAIAPQNHPTFRYTGFYFAATGNKANQAFIADVFQKMLKEQSSVTWTDAAKEENASNLSWANLYFMAACGLFIVWALLLAATIAIARR